MVGGCCSSDGVPNRRTPQDSVVVYNTVTKAWREAPSLNHARSACIAATVGGRVYAMGSSSVVESIAQGGASWREECELPEGAAASASCVLDEKIFIVGPGGAFSFEPSSGAWDALPPIPGMDGGGVGSAQVAAHNGCVWVMGGGGGGLVWSFDPSTREWSAGPELPTAQSWGGAWSVPGVGLLCIGGGHWNDQADTYRLRGNLKSIYPCFLMDVLIGPQCGTGADMRLITAASS